MANPYKTINTRTTSQRQRIPGSVGARQVKNSAGGYVFPVDKWGRLMRFLILGTEGGTYYINERALTAENAKVVFECAAEDGKRLVDTIVEVSLAGRAAKVQPSLFALAIAASVDDDKTRAYALDAVARVCRTGTHLFAFIGFVGQFRGTGSRGMRRALGNWYTNKPVDKVAYQAVKYRNREGWTHRDVLRISHPETSEPDRKVLFDWISGREVDLKGNDSLAIVAGFEAAQAASSPVETARIVSEFSLPWEAVKPEHLNDEAVLNAILDAGMPYGALLRQLPRLTRSGVAMKRKADIARRLTDADAIARSRIHPIAVLNAFETYRNGEGRGGRDWTPVSVITDALDDAFYTSFGNVVPSNKRTLLALDVSGSMSLGRCVGSAFTPRVGSAAMALVTARTEPDYQIMGFSHKLVPLGISARSGLSGAIKTVSNLPFGGTDCSLPMKWALANGAEIDTFVIYTDSETWAGRSGHPVQSLNEYRNRTGIPARMVVVGMTSNGFSIADPQDGGMLDVVGFDSAAPNLISSFSRGEI